MRRKKNNWHHIIPQSRGGDDTTLNLAKVDVKKHDLYHRLFDNKTPEEIVCFLAEYFWKGGWEHVWTALEIAEQNGGRK